MNVLSIAAAYGVLTAIFQWGWPAGSSASTDAVPIVSYVPLFMFAILFGLSMDYEVFLVSQIQEQSTPGRTTAQRSSAGSSTSARVITAAARDHGVRLRELHPQRRPDGQAVRRRPGRRRDPRRDRRPLPARARADDPASATHNWWMPRWLDRIVPHVSIEGAEFFAARDEPAAEPRASPRHWFPDGAARSD